MECLIDLSSRVSGNPWIPVSYESLRVVSRNEPFLQKSFKVACSHWEIPKKLLEENFTHELRESIGVPVPCTVMPSCMDEVATVGKELVFSCLVKPVENHHYYDRFRGKWLRLKTLYNLLATAYQKAERARFEIMLQEFIPGEDSLGVNDNSYLWVSEPKVEFTAQKIRNAPPERRSPGVHVSR